MDLYRSPPRSSGHLNLFSALWPLVMNPSRLGMGLKIRLSSDTRLNRFVTMCYNGVGMRYEVCDAPDVSDAATRETSPAKIVRQYCSTPAYNG